MIDKDLEFLSECSNDKLLVLTDYLVFDKDGKKRLTESLSNTKEFTRNYPDNLKEILPQVIDEFQHFGGNSLMNLIRKHGVNYRTILEDVCDRYKVNYNKSNSTEQLETYLLQKVLITAVDKMSDEDLSHINAKYDKEQLRQAILDGNAMAPAFLGMATLLISQLSKAAAVKIAAVLAGGALARIVAFANPILAVFAAAWQVNDFLGPAYRVTVPFVLTIAYYRKTYLLTDEELKNILK